MTWINEDNLPHAATSGNQQSGPTGESDSGTIMAQEKFTHILNKEGVYEYYCTIHPYMTGKVTVTK